MMTEVAAVTVPDITTSLHILRGIKKSEVSGHFSSMGARCSSMVRAFAHGAMGRRIDPSWGGHIELFLFPASVPRLV